MESSASAEEAVHPDVVDLYRAVEAEDVLDFFEFLGQYSPRVCIDDPVGAAVADFITEVRVRRESFGVCGANIMIEFLTQPYVKDRCYKGTPPTKDENYLQSRSDADIRLKTCAEVGDSAGVRASYLEGGVSYRPMWFKEDGAVHIAARRGFCDTLRAIFENEPASVNHVSLSWIPCTEGISADGGGTPLHLALDNGHDEAAQIILDMKPVLDKADIFDRTPLEIVVLRTIPREYLVASPVFFEYGVYELLPTVRVYLPEIANILINFGADLNLMSGEYGFAVLHIACLNGLLFVVQELLTRGADPNLVSLSPRGYTPLHCAALALQDEVVSCLLSAGADFSVASEDGYTALDIAMKAGMREDAVTTMEEFVTRKGKCDAALYACQLSKEVDAEDAIECIEDGRWIYGRYPLGKCTAYLRPDTREAIERLVTERNCDQNAVFAALFNGCGAGEEGDLSPVRFMGGYDGRHHGLRQIRVRVVAYLVPSLKTRSMLLEFRKARAPDIEVPSVAAAPAEEFDPPRRKARECDEGQSEEQNEALAGRTRRRSKSTECSEVEPPKWFKYIHG